MKENGVVTRFAPSPTGRFHVGGVRTALYNYLFARHTGGKFILRIEDTDKERSKKEYEDEIMDLFSWLGLEHDEFYRQSDRTSTYRKYLEKMIEEGTAYVSKEENPKEGQRDEVIRFKNPNKEVTFKDEILGEITFDTTELADFVIARDLDNPVYHFTVVVDDFEMGVTHIIRGQEHISNTPRQLLLQEAIGATRPLYAHIPLILSKDKTKLSKRDPSVVPAIEYRDLGYLPEALLNFLALIGWNPGGDKEVFSKDELVKMFDISKVQKSGGVFNNEKLEWFNREHIKLLSQEEKIDAIVKNLTDEFKNDPNFSEEKIGKGVEAILERISVFGEISSLCASGELNWLIKQPVYDGKMLLWKTSTADSTKNHLNKVLSIVQDLDSNGDASYWKENIFPYADEVGRGDVLWPLRVSLSGLEKSPDPFTLMSILGKDESISRIKFAIGLC
ncbi:glutamate--tRNA ligase [Candidatus Nomurabacteria bacterium]|nr:glutamate--tRNA ligase [Candidatus Nomurabacteria bacterium]USN94907.1 MAG: glutamate--tRNA ligase [Candidatus Nomurabacteria bacterium]